MSNTMFRCPTCKLLLEPTNIQDDWVECCGKVFKWRDNLAQQTPNIEEHNKISTFKKFDTNKPRVGLILPDFQLELGKALEYGARKYSDDNWKNCDNPERFYEACQRHLLQYKCGEEIDEESGMNHLINAAVDLMFYWKLKEMKK